MRNLLLLIALASLGFCSLAYAQCNTDVGEVGVFWNPDCTQCENCKFIESGPVTAYVVLINPIQTEPDDGVCGWEFCLVNADGTTFSPPGGTIITNYTLPNHATNFLTPPSFSVGIDLWLPWSPCVTMLSIEMLVSDPTPWCFGVKPVSNPTIPGHMLYADYNCHSRIMNPNTGPDAPDYAMACLNNPDCPPYPVVVEESSWGTLKSLYR